MTNCHWRPSIINEKNTKGLKFNCQFIYYMPSSTDTFLSTITFLKLKPFTSWKKVKQNNDIFPISLSFMRAYGPILIDNHWVVMLIVGLGNNIKIATYYYTAFQFSKQSKRDSNFNPFFFFVCAIVMDFVYSVIYSIRENERGWFLTGYFKKMGTILFSPGVLPIFFPL